MVREEECGLLESQELEAEDPGMGLKHLFGTWDLIFLTVKEDEKVYFATSGGEVNVIGEKLF
jgi:hypothetical protein